jgi:hypothetical protein
VTLSLGVKRPGREADHSLPSSAEVETAWSYTFTRQHVFMAWCSVKAQGKITFTFLPLDTTVNILIFVVIKNPMLTKLYINSGNACYH